MHTILKTVIILSLLGTYWCTGNSDTGKSQEFQQEKTVRPTYSSSNVMSRSASQSNLGDISQSSGHFETGIGDGCNDDACLAQTSQDRIGLEAIKSLHRQLDDDANGNVDLSETDEFLREELKFEEGFERRQRAFHRNDDMHISVRELWEAWIRSEVHNWTVEQTSEWLATNVELPQYIPSFIQHQVTGATLPRLAVNNMHYLNNILGIKDPIHKQKIALKAMDIVLFGPPKDYSHHMKDLVLVTLLLGALIGCWYAYRQNKNSRRHLRRMMKDMESLHKAELALDQLQKELERARLEQACVTSEKQNLERQLQQQGSDQTDLHTSYSDLEVSQLKAEIEMLRGELQRAEGELEDRCWSPPVGLQQWLQLTHEVENKAYIKKKNSAEKQLQQAREACEKLRKKRSSLVGAFVSTHGKSIDDVDRSIVEARTSLNEVTQELQERVHRWKQIELLCGFNIINNSGLQYLESVLYRGTANGRGTMRGCLESLHWKEGADSSGSETGKQELDDDFPQDTHSLSSNVHFTVGDSWGEENGPKSQQHPQQQMVRSYSHDTNMSITEREASPPQLSQSETCLDAQRSPLARVTPTKKTSLTNMPSREQPQADDETYSTDSNSTADEDLRRKKRKLFPTFALKHKSKTS
ncbi:stromal interaction molecule homolog isoform X2 [Zootermopsis nevadensis]|uniref:stromal interaction molecule homolog isoform X2 n=1 Tax=Zootermopsis nevadensis TaxID=136037 RepID=UPI000B8ED495|nr:stromal interaction molecule homolog isoform X2 [Zootermopsis nevadensis]